MQEKYSRARSNPQNCSITRALGKNFSSQRGIKIANNNFKTYTRRCEISIRSTGPSRDIRLEVNRPAKAPLQPTGCAGDALSRAARSAPPLSPSLSVGDEQHTKLQLACRLICGDGIKTASAPQTVPAASGNARLHTGAMTAGGLSEKNRRGPCGDNPAKTGEGPTTSGGVPALLIASHCGNGRMCSWPS
jgi:hypothetical protein